MQKDCLTNDPIVPCSINLSAGCFPKFGLTLGCASSLSIHWRFEDGGISLESLFVTVDDPDAAAGEILQVM